MKYTILSLLAFLCFSQVAFSQELIGSRIKLQDTSDISARANKASSVSSPYAEVFQNPLVNSTMQGMGNMMQGFNNSSNSMQEQVKQQMDYAKQQANY